MNTIGAAAVGPRIMKLTQTLLVGCVALAGLMLSTAAQAHDKKKDKHCKDKYEQKEREKYENGVRNGYYDRPLFRDDAYYSPSTCPDRSYDDVRYYRRR